MKLERVTETPSIDVLKDIDESIKVFVKECKIEKFGIDLDGFYKQVRDAIANTIIFKILPHCQFWLVKDELNKVVAWAMTHFSVDIDNRQSIWLTDAWVRKDFRNKPEVLQWIDEIKQFAKYSGCKHVLLTCSRSPRAWNKFLGNKMTSYVSILKEDI